MIFRGLRTRSNTPQLFFMLNTVLSNFIVENFVIIDRKSSQCSISCESREILTHISESLQLPPLQVTANNAVQL